MPEQPNEQYDFELTLDVRDYECDLQGVVNNAVYQNYLEHARHQYLQSLGLSFAGHIAESPGLYDPEAGPPIFQKRARSINRTDRVPYPSREDLLEAAGRLDPEHARQLDREITALPPLLDYEVEIGLVVLRPFSAAQLSNPNFAAASRQRRHSFLRLAG